MESVQNILWVKERSERGIFEALKKGNFYVKQGVSKWSLLLDEFYVSSGGQEAICGQEITHNGPVHIHMRISATDKSSHNVKVSIVRNGAIVNILEAATPAELVYQDAASWPGTSYYRIYAESGPLNHRD